VVNTSKVIPERKAPSRDQKFMTNVPGIYLIGDVSGVPMIKNAINEGGAVIDYIVEDLKQTPANGDADYDVAIIGIGPAGLSAAAIAKQRGMKYIAIEQNQVLATIQQLHQAGKLLYFKPEGIKVTGGIPLPNAPASKEVVVQSWMETMRSHQIRINEFESCKGIEPDDGAFVVTTEQEKTRRKIQYRASRVIVAIGNRGAAMKLNAPGEDLKIKVTPIEPVLPAFCAQCGARRLRQARFCRECGAKYAIVSKVPAARHRGPPTNVVKPLHPLPRRASLRYIVVVEVGKSHRRLHTSAGLNIRPMPAVVEVIAHRRGDCLGDPVEREHREKKFP
jgi:hypothetical protein